LEPFLLAGCFARCTAFRVLTISLPAAISAVSNKQSFAMAASNFFCHSHPVGTSQVGPTIDERVWFEKKISEENNRKKNEENDLKIYFWEEKET
jgi:hypothetical protein